MERMVNLGVKEIKNLISTRNPYLLIDKVTEIIPGTSARGYKCLTANEWFFPVHFPENPMMPGMIQMEALLQMLSLTVLAIDGNAGLPIRGIAANNIRLRERVAPGCKMFIESELLSFEDGIAEGTARGIINDHEVCSGSFTFRVLKEIDKNK